MAAPDWLARLRRHGLAQVHLAVLLAGSTGLFVKLVAIDSLLLTSGRTLFGTAALALLALLSAQSLRLRSWRDLAMLALSGAVLAFHWFSFFYSIQISTIAIGLLAFASFPVFSTLLEPLLFGEPLHRRDLVTMTAVTAGLVLLTPAWDMANQLTMGLFWGLLSAFSYAVLALLSRSYVRHYPAVCISFYQQGFAALCLLPFAWPGLQQLAGTTWLALLVIGVVFTALTQLLVVSSLRTLRVQTVSVIFGLEPVYGILLAWLLVSEPLNSRTIAGGMLICGAVFWASWQRNRETLQAARL